MSSSFMDNISSTELADMQLLSEYNVGILFFLCVIDLLSKYAWVVSLKDKKGGAITKVFHQTVTESSRKSNKMWVNKSSEFYNRSIKSWLKDNSIEICSTYNEEKSVVKKQFIRPLKNKIYKHRIAI